MRLTAEMTTEAQPIRVMRVEIDEATYDALKHLAINEHCSMASLLGRGALLVINARKEEKST